MGPETITADGARWTQTGCDACAHGGLFVLVPVAADGKPRATCLPSLCFACAHDPEIRAKHERRARDA